MGYMSVKDENFPRAQGVLRGKYFVALVFPWAGPSGTVGICNPLTGSRLHLMAASLTSRRVAFVPLHTAHDRPSSLGRLAS